MEVKNFFSNRFVQNFHETSSVRCVKIASRVQITEQQKWERTSLALSAVACCLGSCEASLKYLCLTVPAPLPVCFPWCTSPSLAWRGQWKRPLFLSLWGMSHALMTQSGRNYSLYTPGMSLSQFSVKKGCSLGELRSVWIGNAVLHKVADGTIQKVFKERNNWKRIHIFS